MDEIKEADRLLLLLDYDGTLTPIVGTPKGAVLSDSMRQLLGELTQHKKIDVCIVSGRSLEDIKNLVNIHGIIYVGNHGFEAAGIRYEVPGLNPLKLRPFIKEICHEIAERLRDINGVLIDEKGLTASVHYRQVSEEEIDAVKEKVEEVINSYSEVKLTEGRKVLEIRPSVDWDKGRIAALIVGTFSEKYPKENILPIYIGDDATDEDAFEALKEKGVTILVSVRRKPTSASYYIRNQGEVIKFLKLLSKI